MEAWAQANIINQTTRKVQNNFNAVQCLESSIDSTMKKRILADKENCKIAGVIIAALIFNVIMIKSEPSGMGTVRALKQEIRALESVIPNMKIDQFNDHVNGLITTLSSHGVAMPDLIDHLFAAYRKAADSKFREHITDIEHKWLRGEPQYANYTADQLMADALAEFNLRVSDKSSPWGALSEEQEEILLLKAEIKKVTADYRKKKNRSSTSTAGTANQSQSQGQEGNDNSSKANVPKWKLVPSKDGTKTMVKNGKTYHWCQHHYDKGMWALHEPKECKNRKEDYNETPSKTMQAHMAEDSDEDSLDEIQAAIAILAQDSDEE